MRRVAPHPQWEIFSSYGLLVGAFWKISWGMRCYYKCAQLKAGFILYPIHTLHIRMPSPSVLEPRVSKAAQVSVACTEHISEQQGDINRPGDKNRPTIVRGFIFTKQKPQTHTLFFGCDIQRINVNQTVFKAAFVLLFFLFSGDVFFGQNTKALPGERPCRKHSTCRFHSKRGRLREFYGSLPCPEVKSKIDGCLWQDMIWLGDWNLGLGNDWWMGW